VEIEDETRATVCVVGEANTSNMRIMLLLCPKHMASMPLLPRTPFHRFSNAGVMTRLWLHDPAMITKSIRIVSSVLNSQCWYLDWPNQYFACLYLQRCLHATGVCIDWQGSTLRPDVSAHGLCLWRVSSDNMDDIIRCADALKLGMRNQRLIVQCRATGELKLHLMSLTGGDVSYL